MKSFLKNAFLVAAVAAVLTGFYFFDHRDDARQRCKCGAAQPALPGQPDPRIAELQCELQKTREQLQLVMIEERVMELPEDGNQWHTILIVRNGFETMPAERRALAMFASEPALVSLRAQTHWHQICTNQVEFKKFAALVDATPCLLIERANGQVVFRESGPQLGNRPGALTRSIRKEISRHCPDGRCLPLHPVPGPGEPAPTEEVPAVLQDEADAHPRRSPLGLFAVGAAAAISAALFRFHQAAQ